jgi:hypothetical protein
MIVKGKMNSLSLQQIYPPKATEQRYVPCGIRHRLDGALEASSPSLKLFSLFLTVLYQLLLCIIYSNSVHCAPHFHPY